MLIVNKLKQKGIRGTVRTIKNRLMTISNGYVCNLENVTVTSHSDHDEYEFIPLNLDDLNKIKVEYHDELNDHKYNILKNRIGSKEIMGFFVKTKDNNIGGYFHISLIAVRDGTINMEIQVPNGTGYLFDDYTFVPFRGRGLHQYSIRKRIEYLKKIGKSYALVNILNGNIPSEKSYLGLGFKMKKKYYYIHTPFFEKTLVKEIDKHD